MQLFVEKKTCDNCAANHWNKSLGHLWDHTFLGTRAYPGAHFMHESFLLAQSTQLTSLTGLGMTLPHRPKHTFVPLATSGCDFAIGVAQATAEKNDRIKAGRTMT
jgi:hypothetical protein